MVGKDHAAKTHGEGVGTWREKVGHLCNLPIPVTLTLVCQFYVIRLHKQIDGMTEQKLFICRIKLSDQENY